MSRLLIVPVLLALAYALWFWFSGGFDQIATLAAQQQREFQNSIARTLRALRAGGDGSLLVLMAACFAYGFFHAVGPGHGKVLIGGYGLGRKVPALRLATIGMVASLGQAVTAIVLVYAGVFLLSLGHERMVGLTEDIMAPISYAAIALIGGWLILRGMNHARKSIPDHPHHEHTDSDSCDHDHGADHDGACGSCGHRHGPTPQEVAEARTLTEALILIAGIAVRPCTGALFVLLITWQMGIPLAGIAGAFAMALGTGAVTVAVGLGAVGMRGGLVASLANGRLATHLLPAIEIFAGLLIFLIAAGLLIRSLS
ncbi:nickel/cobalt transporter [Sedimentitalea sp. XS_ASV28]|uniref:nickel/cobalt transporter n=1 Tax=Sedimentitalea sp. XS_ASV28 TaxID=3241296 RepID=UPI003513AE25